jgi:hypothetical protein
MHKKRRRWIEFTIFRFGGPRCLMTANARPLQEASIIEPPADERTKRAPAVAF